VESPEQERTGSTVPAANRFIALSDIRAASNLGFALPSKNSEPGEVRPLS
jgi:hypothetical protein